MNFTKQNAILAFAALPQSRVNQTLNFVTPAMTQSNTRTVFFISDGTGITAETLGHSLLAQFPDCRFRQVRLPFVDNLDKAIDCATQIREAAESDGVRPIVFNTLVNPDSVDVIQSPTRCFSTYSRNSSSPLESELGQRSTHAVGRFHGIAESLEYKKRIEAINFTLAHDDGISSAELAEADVILVGSRARARPPPASTWRCSSA